MQHRRDLPSAGTDSDPDGNQNIQGCWYRTDPNKATTPASFKPEQVPHQLSDNLEEDYSIIDTQSMYSYIGEDTTGPLYVRMKAEGCEPPEV